KTFSTQSRSLLMRWNGAPLSARRGGGGGEGEVVDQPRAEPMVREPGDHRGVVDAVRHRGEAHGKPALLAKRKNLTPEARVRGDAAPDDDRAAGVRLERAVDLEDHRGDGGALEAGGDVGLFLFGEVGARSFEHGAPGGALRRLAAHGVEDGGLEPAEGEIERVGRDAADGEVVRAVVALLR